MNEMKIKMADGREATVYGVAVICKCGGEAFIGMDNTITKDACIMHNEPQCKDFLELDPLEYAVFLRKHHMPNVIALDRDKKYR